MLGPFLDAASNTAQGDSPAGARASLTFVPSRPCSLLTGPCHYFSMRFSSGFYSCHLPRELLLSLGGVSSHHKQPGGLSQADSLSLLLPKLRLKSHHPDQKVFLWQSLPCAVVFLCPCPVLLGLSCQTTSECLLQGTCMALVSECRGEVSHPWWL